MRVSPKDRTGGMEAAREHRRVEEVGRASFVEAEQLHAQLGPEEDEQGEDKEDNDILEWELLVH